MNKTIAEQEEAIKQSLITLLRKINPNAKLNDIDEIVLSYVVGILEDLGTGEDSEDNFDVKSFCEILSAYFPEFANVDHEIVCKWIFELSSYLSKVKGETVIEEPEPEKERIEISLGKLNLSGSLPSSGRSRHSSSECSNPEFNTDHKKRIHLLSEASDGSSDSSDYLVNEESYMTSELQVLQELFPRSSIVEVRHCLAVADGDVERAAQIVLHRQDAGQTINGYNCLQSLFQKQRYLIGDDEMKKNIIAKYSYVDKSEDSREHRPVDPKPEPKKLVRYRDNKIVSLKGERYTEVKNDDSDEPPRPLRPPKARGH